MNFHLIHIPIYEVVPLSRYFPITITLRRTEMGEFFHFTAVLRLEADDKGCIYLDGGCTLGVEKPSFCKAFPFSIVPGGEGKNLVLMDMNCPGFSEVDGEPIFMENSELNKTINDEFLQFAYLIKEDAERSREFFSEMSKHGLIRGSKFVYKLGEEQREFPFNMIDEKKLLELPKKTLEDFAQKGYMRLIYAHLNSVVNFSRLFNTYLKRNK